MTKGKRDILVDAEQWPTTTVGDATEPWQPLPRATAAARDHKGTPSELTRENGASRLDQLDRQAEAGFPVGRTFHCSPPPETTPAGTASSTDSSGSLLHYRRWLYWRLGVPYAIPTNGEDELKLNPVRLNPCFAEWLMGWPIGATDCGASATASSANVPLSHWRSCSLSLVSSLLPAVFEASAVPVETQGRLFG